MAGSEISPGAVSREMAESLASKLKQFPGPHSEREQLILDLLIHILTDPIERLKLGPAEQFSEAEEAILLSLGQKGSQSP